MPSPNTSEASDNSPYGLEILHEPGTRPTTLVQIIFVHGLGGSKRGTWTHSKTNFWPMWLHEEEGFKNVRIALFGYNANFNVLAPNTNLSIPTFANQLLFSMDQLNYRHGSVYWPLSSKANFRRQLFLLRTAWEDWWLNRYITIKHFLTSRQSLMLTTIQTMPHWSKISRPSYFLEHLTEAQTLPTYWISS